MSEPDISPLARRLAEQNNVEWRQLTGTGDGGKVVERDVLDYLARVMVGEEALDPTPEPLPEGMESWPDQDPNLGSREPAPFASAAQMGAAPEASDVDGDEWLLGGAGTEVGEAPQEAWLESSEEEELPTDIFLLDEEPEEAIEPLESLEPLQLDPEPAAPLPPSEAAEAEGEALSYGDQHDFGDQREHLSDEPPVEPVEPVSGADLGGPDDLDESLLLAGDLASAPPTEQPTFEEAPQAEAFAGEASDALFEPPAEPSADQLDAPSEVDAEEAPPLGREIDDYTEEFTTPLEELGEEFSSGPWEAEASAPQADTQGSGIDADLGMGDLTDLWGDPTTGELETPDSHSPPAMLDAFDQDELEQSEALDALTEAEPLDDLAELDGLDAPPAAAETLTDSPSPQPDPAVSGPDLTPSAAAAGLPLLSTGTVIRRHVHLNALTDARSAAALELGMDEPVGLAPFLLRAVAKAATESDFSRPQVTFAELGSELRLRRVDDAASRSFGSLVRELREGSLEEDEVGLVVVDLSDFDLDEVVLNVGAPTVTLGRLVQDAQGELVSTLSLTGEFPVKEGAALLTRVAELLTAPVRLLL